MSEIKVIWKVVGRKIEKDIEEFENEVNRYLSQGWRLVNGSLGGSQGLMAFIIKD